MKSVILRLILFVADCTLIANQAYAQNKFDEYKFQFEEGIYCFAMNLVPDRPDLVGVASTFRPNQEGETATLVHKAMALDKMLDKLQRVHKTILRIYIPTAEQDVVKRIQNAAYKLNTSKNMKRSHVGVNLTKLITETNVYNELRTVLLRHGMDIASIDVENVIPKKISGTEDYVPDNWTTYITLKKAEHAVEQAVKSNKP